MKYGEAFPSKYLAAADIPDEGLTLTIGGYSMQEIGQGDNKEQKPILYFRERDVKELVLNKTNAKIIIEVTGTDDLDEWAGHKITLVPREVEFQGDTVWAIRIQKPRRQQNRTATAAQAPVKQVFANQEPPPIDESDIPFAWIAAFLTTGWVVLQHGQGVFQVWGL